MLITPGTHIGRYEIKSQIGVGGMGEVYLAQDMELARRVAIKVLAQPLASDQRRMTRFVQEAQAASALNHPNILTIHEIGRADGLRFIATEFVEGETLRERLRRAGVSLDEALDIATQVAGALSAAHAAGIIHRDIKPENIMLRRDGIVKVLDFGLAKLTESSLEGADTQAPTRAIINTEPGVIMGTAAYMSPEQARGLETDERTDIWSLGCVLYEMIAGESPFRGGTASDIIASILKTTPKRLQAIMPEVPQELDRIVMKALEKERGDRYQTAKDLLVDLRQLKKQLELRAEIERTAKSRTETVVDNTSRVLASPSTSSDTLYAASGIGRHKFASIAALLLLLSAIGVAGYWYLGRARAGADKIESIAVLPFANLSQDPNAEYLSDGIAESLINSLSQLPNLKVMSRKSTFRYKGKEQDAQKAASELNVRAVLTGEMKQVGDQLAINVELIDARDNHQIWGDQYVRKLSDVIAVQREIAQEVSDKLRLKLTSAEARRLSKQYTDNAEAYQLYLKGRYYRNRFTIEGFRQAIDMFNQALSLDPNYALAYAGLADTYYYSTPLLLSAPEGMAKAKESAQKALGLDDQLAEAHLSLGLIRFLNGWEFAEAQREFKRSIELNPNLADAHFWYSQYLALIGQLDEAMSEAKTAQQLDPLSPLTSTQVGFPHFLAGRYDEAVAANLHGIELNPNATIIHINLSVTYSVKGECEKGIAEAQRALQLVNKPDVRTFLAYGYACAGDRAAAEQALKQALNDTQNTPPSPYNVALVYIALRDKEQAFGWLEKAYQERSEYMTWLKADPRLESVRSDPRFQDLLRRVGLQ